jgi:hypothetical protein
MASVSCASLGLHIRTSYPERPHSSFTFTLPISPPRTQQRRHRHEVVPPSLPSSYRRPCHGRLRLGANRLGLAPIPLSSSGSLCPRSSSFPMSSRSHRCGPKPPPCRCYLYGDPKSRIKVRNLPCPLSSPPLLSIVHNCSKEFPSATAELPHHEPSPFGAPTLVQHPPSDFPHPSPSSQTIPTALRPRSAHAPHLQ